VPHFYHVRALELGERHGSWLRARERERESVERERERERRASAYHATRERERASVEREGRKRLGDARRLKGHE
jgi:hypothetical protein